VLLSLHSSCCFRCIRRAVFVAFVALLLSYCFHFY
jgi:hypothetical protein